MRRKMTLRDIVGLKEGMFAIAPEAKLNARTKRNLHLVLTWIGFIKFRQIKFFTFSFFQSLVRIFPSVTGLWLIEKNNRKIIKK